MAKDDNKAEDTEIDESTEQPEAPETNQEVELDRPTEVQGDLVENPVLEEVDEPDEGETATEVEPDEATSEETTETEEPVEEVASEADESGVYAPATASDPGAFQPKGDYAFEVTTSDGKTVKINDLAEAEAFAQRLDTDEGLLTAYQFTQFQRKLLKMDSGIDRERIQYEADKEVYDRQQAQTEVRNQQVMQWNNEINYLRAKGMLPDITPELNSANWTDPKVADQAAVKETLAVFKWMETENSARRDAGIAEVTSAVDAYRMMQAEQADQEAVTERKREIGTRRSRGSMVSGNSSFTSSNEQSNSIIGEGGSLQDLIHEYSNSI